VEVHVKAINYACDIYIYIYLKEKRWKQAIDKIYVRIKWTNTKANKCMKLEVE